LSPLRYFDIYQAELIFAVLKVNLLVLSWIHFYRLEGMIGAELWFVKL